MHENTKNDEGVSLPSNVIRFIDSKVADAAGTGRTYLVAEINRAVIDEITSTGDIREYYAVYGEERVLGAILDAIWARLSLGPDTVVVEVRVDTFGHYVGALISHMNLKDGCYPCVTVKPENKQHVIDPRDDNFADTAISGLPVAKFIALPHCTDNEIIRTIAEHMRRKYSQKVVLCSAHSGPPLACGKGTHCWQNGKCVDIGSGQCAVTKNIAVFGEQMEDVAARLRKFVRENTANIAGNRSLAAYSVSMLTTVAVSFVPAGIAHLAELAAPALEADSSEYAHEAASAIASYMLDNTLRFPSGFTHGDYTEIFRALRLQIQQSRDSEMLEDFVNAFGDFLVTLGDNSQVRELIKRVLAKKISDTALGDMPAKGKKGPVYH